MNDLRQQADHVRKMWATYKTWADDPQNSDMTRKTLGVIVERLDAEALRLDAAARKQAEASAHTAAVVAAAEALSEA